MTYNDLLGLLFRGSSGFLNPQSLAVGSLMSMAGPWGFPLSLAGSFLGGGEKRYFSLNVAVNPKIYDVQYVTDKVLDSNAQYYGFDPGWVYMKMGAPYDPALDHGESSDQAVSEYILRYNPRTNEVEYLAGQNPETGQSIWQPVGTYITAYQTGAGPVDDKLGTIIIPENLYYSIHDALGKNDLEELWGMDTVPAPIEYDIVGDPDVYNGIVTTSFDIKTGEMTEGIVPIGIESDQAKPKSTLATGGGSMASGTFSMSSSSSTSVPQWAEDLWDEFMKLVMGVDMDQSWADTLVQTQQALKSFYESIAGEYSKTIGAVQQTMDKMTSQSPVKFNFGDTPIGEWIPYSKSIPSYAGLIGQLLSNQASLGAPYAALASIPQASMMSVLQPMLSQWDKQAQMSGYGNPPKQSTSILQGATGLVNLIAGLGNAADAVGKISDLFKSSSSTVPVTTTPTTTNSMWNSLYDTISKSFIPISWDNLFKW